MLGLGRQLSREGNDSASVSVSSRHSASSQLSTYSRMQSQSDLHDSAQDLHSHNEYKQFCDGNYWGEYVGSISPAGERSGHGKMTWENGESYVGSWVDDKRSGHGITRSPNGDVYSGQYLDGKRDGLGTYRVCEANGADAYVGEWSENKRAGKGTYHHGASGVVEVGWYRDNKDCGRGVRWSTHRDTAWMLEDGEVVKEIELKEAREIALSLGFDDVPPPDIFGLCKD